MSGFHTHSKPDVGRSPLGNVALPHGPENKAK
jgi:hypothetical protein